jgi:hypothetical protein
VELISKIVDPNLNEDVPRLSSSAAKSIMQASIYSMNLLQISKTFNLCNPKLINTATPQSRLLYYW